MLQQWFKDAKLGISLHWGIYAVLGIPESWSFHNGQISYEDYIKQCEKFTASNYDPKHWAEVFRKAGAKYVVLTSKHHDGVALWDTQYSDLNVVKRTPAGKDLIGPYCETMRNEGLKVGLYFSHLDWSNQDYVAYTEATAEVRQTPEYQAMWDHFLQFHRGQLQELTSRYGTIDMFTFDGDWDHPAEVWKMKELRDMLHKANPNIVLNSRMRGYGDFETPEQGMPVIPYEDQYWEFWFTTNDSWGIQYQDQNYKTLKQIIWMFCDCIGLGGNVLWNVAPYEDGTLDPKQEELLLSFGEWITPVQEAVYGTTAGLPFGHYAYPSTLSKDKQTLYLFYPDIPQEAIPVKGIYNKIRRIEVLKSGKELSSKVIGGAPWLHVPGVLWIDLKPEDTDPNMTVIKIELDGPLQLYRGAGQAISVN
ncbi:MAG: alpha-L-fucosidase [Clostridiales bacterium]|nr:alpha-L-fucosidase [Clostridiales bacterium]